MKFGVSGTDDVMSDWTARATPFLPANHPHQQCVQETRTTGRPVCHCVAGPCQESCCKSSDEEVL